jgi:hypothetical protein
LIAMKREVAAMKIAGFPWSECQVRKLATSHCTNFILNFFKYQACVSTDAEHTG